MGKSYRSRPISSPREITLRLDAMTYGGDALGRAGGQAVFVTGGIAGELVRAQIFEEHEGFARARVLEVIEPSLDRVLPRCPYFGFEATACGGCHWQHIGYAAQLRFKTEIVREQLRRIGRIAAAPVRDILPAPNPWAYRNQARFSLTPDGRPGFQAARSRRVVPIEVCHIVQLPILAWLKGNQQVQPPTRDPISVRVPDIHAREAGSPTAHFQIKDAMFQVSAGSFFQVNTSLIEPLIDQVVSKLDARAGQSALDAYCGVGLFSRFIAPTADRVIGIESSRSAMADARVNLAQFEQVDLRVGRVEEILPALPTPIDAAVVDPPRAGCGPQVIQALIERSIKRLVYVSCDPATLARDARQLIDSGYRLVEVQPVDMFPQTYHLETVTLFLKANQAIL